MTRDQAEHERHITFLRGILEQSLAGIYVISNGQFDYVNQTFADIFGYASPAEIISSIKVEDLVSPECRELVLGNIRKRTTGAVNELRYAFTGLRKDGARNLVEVHGRTLESAGQRMVIGLLLHWGAPAHAGAVAMLLVAQAVLMARFLQQPVQRALFYSGFGVPLFVAGMMVSAFALRALGGAAP